MAEPFETLREVGVALDGLRSETSGQFTTLKWIMGGSLALGVVVAGMLFTKVDRLEEIAARNTAILERIEKTLNEVASNTSDIKKAVASIDTKYTGPNPGVFSGWRGAPATELMLFQASDGSQKLNDAWVFYPESE